MASGTSRKNSCLNQALFQMVVAVSGEHGGGCLGRLPLGNSPAYLARAWASPYLLTLACLSPGLRTPSGTISGPGPFRAFSMTKKRAQMSLLTPVT